jgi:hypothetical protein
MPSQLPIDEIDQMLEEIGQAAQDVVVRVKAARVIIEKARKRRYKIWEPFSSPPAI